ncbi:MULTISPECIES: MCE family protein [unclassified Mycobacterium]|uniref:MCE family protein n=1 Tax=unclassified Mycobacterium TaxID=2642494 RepID=UPI0029C61E3D|nr:MULTISPECIES: MCE family protein [unclassified Mycobacterium]
MEPRSGEGRLHPAWWTAVLVAIIAALTTGTVMAYTGSLKSYVPVTVASDRSGLVMDTGAKVMLNGVQVGHVTGVAGVAGGQQPVELRLDIDAAQVKYIPSNVGAQIRATTVFGSKFVDLIYPDAPSPQPLVAGAVLMSRNVTTEVNTVFENLVGLLDQIDPAKLNAVLAALSQGFRGQGERIGQAITDANQVLLQINPRSEAIRQDWRSLKGLSDTYGAAAGDIVSVLDAASTTSTTISDHAAALDTLLLSAIGFAQAGTNVLAPNQRSLVDAINILEPTTNLLMTYDPSLTCTLVGAKWFLDHGGYKGIGGNGRTLIADATLIPGNDKYNYPDNLPIVAAKGGPGGKPSCGSLPDVSKMYPVRQLVTNTGWGTGLDIRPNPGVAPQTCYANFLPVTRAVPEPPSIRDCLPGPAIGPVTAPGMPPYGAPLYGAGGVPLWPGIPPAGTPPPVPVPGTPVAPNKMSPQPPAVLGAPPPPTPAPPPVPEAPPLGSSPNGQPLPPTPTG